MNVTECDNCRKLGPMPAWEWIVAIVQKEAESSFMAMLGGGNSQAEVAGMFCSWRCVAQYAVARALVAEAEAAGGTAT